MEKGKQVEIKEVRKKKILKNPKKQEKANEMFMKSYVRLAMHTLPWLQVNWPDFVVDLGVYCAEEERAILIRPQSTRRKIDSGKATASMPLLRTHLYWKAV